MRLTIAGEVLGKIVRWLCILLSWILGRRTTVLSGERMRSASEWKTFRDPESGGY